MREWWQAQQAQGFPDFHGTVISGSIPVKEALINELIARFLAETGTAPGGPSIVDRRELARFVRSPTVHAEPGVVTVRFEIGV
jgi:hypothetical protein